MESEKLSIYDIIHGMFLAIDNAQALIDDAELLFKNDRIPRTFVLAQLASEEIGKAFILYNLYMGLKIDESQVNHQKIRKSFYDHKAKTFEATMADFMRERKGDMTEDELNAEVAAICAEVIKGRDEYNILKNRGLYVSQDDGKFIRPEEVITREEAEAALIKAKERKATTYMVAEREVDFDIKYGTHPRLHTDLNK